MTYKKNQWAPTITLEKLKIKADILAKIRAFFAKRHVTEVDTPLACSAPVTDPFIQAMQTSFQPDPSSEHKTLYLQTSPEYAMKRLLASGSGDIYQICKAFRNGETGRIHNPEFTMLEWYRLGFNDKELMHEVAELVQLICGYTKCDYFTYQDIFQRQLDIDPLTVSVDVLENVATNNNISLSNSDRLDKDSWLQLLMSHVIEPTLGFEYPAFIYHFPASQACLARLNSEDPQVAGRFELYVKGIELANGFHELTDADEQRRRFNEDIIKRQTLGLPLVPIDEYLLSALQSGLPDCAGVALGVDRLVMLATDSSCIDEVMGFTIKNA